MRLCEGHDRQLAAELGQADHKLNMWLKAVLMEDRRLKLKAGRGGLPSPPTQNTIILKESHGRETALSFETRFWHFYC